MCKKPHELTAFLEGLFAFERAHLRTQRIYQPDFRVKWENSTIFSCIFTTYFFKFADFHTRPTFYVSKTLFLFNPSRSSGNAHAPHVFFLRYIF